MLEAVSLVWLVVVAFWCGYFLGVAIGSPSEH